MIVEDILLVGTRYLKAVSAGGPPYGDTREGWLVLS
jgi:hypothetical protein